ncbi:MAG: hypothetical protein ABIA77_01935, partial [Candidatus Omnitrophota bacterium]
RFSNDVTRPYVAVLTRKTGPYTELVQSGAYDLALGAYFDTGDIGELEEMIAFAAGQSVLSGRAITEVFNEWAVSYGAFYRNIPAERRAGMRYEPISPEEFRKKLSGIQAGITDNACKVTTGDNTYLIEDENMRKVAAGTEEKSISIKRFERTLNLLGRFQNMQSNRYKMAAYVTAFILLFPSPAWAAGFFSTLLTGLSMLPTVILAIAVIVYGKKYFKKGFAALISARPAQEKEDSPAAVPASPEGAFRDAVSGAVAGGMAFVLLYFASRSDPAWLNDAFSTVPGFLFEAGTIFVVLAAVWLLRAVNAVYRLSYETIKEREKSRVRVLRSHTRALPAFISGLMTGAVSAVNFYFALRFFGQSQVHDFFRVTGGFVDQITGGILLIPAVIFGIGAARYLLEARTTFNANSIRKMRDVFKGKTGGVTPAVKKLKNDTSSGRDIFRTVIGISSGIYDKLKDRSEWKRFLSLVPEGVLIVSIDTARGEGAALRELDKKTRGIKCVSILVADDVINIEGPVDIIVEELAEIVTDLSIKAREDMIRLLDPGISALTEENVRTIKDIGSLENIMKALVRAHPDASSVELTEKSIYDLRIDRIYKDNRIDYVSGECGSLQPAGDDETGGVRRFTVTAVDKVFDLKLLAGSIGERRKAMKVTDPERDPVKDFVIIRSDEITRNNIAEVLDVTGLGEYLSPKRIIIRKANETLTPEQVLEIIEAKTGEMVRMKQVAIGQRAGIIHIDESAPGYLFSADNPDGLLLVRLEGGIISQLYRMVVGIISNNDDMPEWMPDEKTLTRITVNGKT